MLGLWFEGEQDDDGGAEESQGEEDGEIEVGEEVSLEEKDGFGEGEKVESELVGLFVG